MKGILHISFHVFRSLNHKRRLIYIINIGILKELLSCDLNAGRDMRRGMYMFEDIIMAIVFIPGISPALFDAHDNQDNLSDVNTRV